MGEMSTGSGGPDSDAPWRRGFEGWEATAAPADPPTRTAAGPSDRSSGSIAASPSPASLSASLDGRSVPDVGVGRRRPKLVAACGVVVIVAVVIMGALLLGDGEGARASMAPALPESVDRSWTLEFDRVIDDVALAGDLIIIGAAGGLSLLELADGREVWSRPELLGGSDIEIERMAVSEDRILVQMASVSGSDVRAFDLETADELWASDRDEGATTIQYPADRPSVLRRSRVDGRSVGQLIDPATGTPVGEPMTLSSVSATARHLGIEPADRQVAIWSTDVQDVVAGPVDSFGLRTVAPLDGAVVAVDLDGRIAAFDDEGLRVDERLVAATDGDTTVRADLLGVAASPSTAVVGSDTSIGFTVEDDDIMVRWRRDGRASDLSDVTAGTVCLLVEPDAPGAARVAVVDATTGRTVASPPDGRERLPLLASNGYLAAPQPGSNPRVVEAFDYDDRPLWSLRIADDADWDLLDGAVVIVERTLATSVLTVAR